MEKNRNRKNEVFNHYVLEKMIYGDEESLAHVYLGVCKNTGTKLAFKFSAKEFNDKFFKKEAEILSKLNHNNILKPVFSELEGSEIFFASPFIEFEENIHSIGDYIQEKGQLDVQTAVEITKQTLEALIYAHSKGVIHRDIKPNNILITKENSGIRVYLTDFNLAKDEDSNSIRSVSTMGGGSSMYQSPEQENGDSKHIDQKTDVYSLGLTLNVMLTGKKKWQYDPRKIRDDVPNELAELVLDSLKDYNERLPTAKEFLERLKQVRLPKYSAKVKEKIDSTEKSIYALLEENRHSTLSSETIDGIQQRMDSLDDELREFGEKYVPARELQEKLSSRNLFDEKTMKDFCSEYDKKYANSKTIPDELKERAGEYLDALQSWKPVKKWLKT